MTLPAWQRLAAFVNPLTPALHESESWQEFGGGEMSNAELVARLERQFAGLGNLLTYFAEASYFLYV